MGRTQISVILIIFCAAKCMTMSYNELEDFAEYIKRTSQLSPILKKGVQPEEHDENEDVSDDAWEESGKFEGDLILNDRQRRVIVENIAEGLSRNGIRDDTKRWPNNEVIYYIQVEHFSNDQISAITNALDDLAQESCIKFRRYRKGDPDAVVIQGSRRGCFSQVGYQSGYQVLNLSGRHPVGRGCFRHGTIVHEMLHTLGFYHMQSSPIRDDYVDIAWENIIQAARHNFRKYNSFSVSNFGVDYDYDSVLHYSRRAFSVNGKDTIIPKQAGAQIGQRLGLSDKDKQKLNRMYCEANEENLQDDDDSNKSKKKINKKKPLVIEGLGYHQGKAVSFKVLPTAAPHTRGDEPSSYVFDDFSKTPQIVSTPENEDVRVGKEITYSFNRPESLSSQEYSDPIYDAEPEFQYYENKQWPKYQSGEYIEEEKKTNIPNEKNSNQSIQPLRSTVVNTQDPSLSDALDRLSKILQSHVYPSQTPDLSIYKLNNNHNTGIITPQNDQKQQVLLILAPVTNPSLKSGVPYATENFYDLSNYKTIKPSDNQYHPNPTVGSFYANDRTNKQVRDRAVVNPLDNSQKETKYIQLDPGYAMTFSKEEDDKISSSPYMSPEQYRQLDQFERYSSNEQDTVASPRNQDEWRHHKYTPYQYGLPKYEKGDQHNGLQYSSAHSDYGPAPARIKEYFFYPSDKYTVSNPEDR